MGQTHSSMRRVHRCHPAMSTPLVKPARDAVHYFTCKNQRPFPKVSKPPLHPSCAFQHQKWPDIRHDVSCIDMYGRSRSNTSAALPPRQCRLIPAVHDGKTVDIDAPTSIQRALGSTFVYFEHPQTLSLSAYTRIELRSETGGHKFGGTRTQAFPMSAFQLDGITFYDRSPHVQLSTTWGDGGGAGNMDRPGPQERLMLRSKCTAADMSVLVRLGAHGEHVDSSSAPLEHTPRHQELPPLSYWQHAIRHWTIVWNRQEADASSA